MANETNGNGSGSKLLVGLLTGMTILSGMTAVVTPLYFLTASHDEQLKETREEALRASYHRGQVDERLIAMRDRQDKNVVDIASLDERLQREMRDVNAVTDAKLQGLDVRLQGEIGTVSQLLQSAVEEIQANVSTGRERQILSRVNVGRLDERMNALESKKP